LQAEVDPPDPAARADAYSLGFLALGALGALSGIWIIPIYRRVDYAAADPDVPVPFGPRTAWLALETTETDRVVAALGLQDVRAATWAEGIKAVQQSSVFVTPPLADWTLAVGTALIPPDRAEAFVKPLLERLSRQFGDAQYFCTHHDYELHVWARARKGRLVRGYGWLGQKSLTLWDEGGQTKEERDLGFSFLAGGAFTTAPARDREATAPDEDCVMQVAALWSIDPSTLNEHYLEPATGLLGSPSRDETRVHR
jgi:hypothetical protein